MLRALGLSQIEELFRDIPPKARVQGLGLPPAREEEEVIREVDRLLRPNRPLEDFDSFLGGGIYSRPVPALVDGILQRSEFYTSYTQYQPEASQGMLQALFEFQSLWVELTGMEVSNASLYDGGTARGEALLMARRLHEGNRFLVPSTLSWETKSILKNYGKGPGAHLVEIPQDPETGRLDLDFISRESRKDCFGILTEMPDPLGLLHDEILDLRSRIGDLPWVVGTDPLALLGLEPPGDWGADIVVGEGQGFGIAPSYGGPLLGLMACRRRDIRQLPGRLVGQTQDHDGRRAFTLTLQTREQHIRRSRATSNICTNQALMTLAFLGYASALGPRGLFRALERSSASAHRLQEGLSRLPGLRAPAWPLPFLYEFPLRTPSPPRALLDALFQRGILGGIPFPEHRPGSPSAPFPGLLVATGPATDERAVDRYVEAVRSSLPPGGAP